MKPAESFGVVVRSIGLVGLIVAAFYAISAGVALVWPAYRAGISPWWHYVIACLVFSTSGSVLLRKADWIVNFAYPQRKPGESDV